MGSGTFSLLAPGNAPTGLTNNAVDVAEKFDSVYEQCAAWPQLIKRRSAHARHQQSASDTPSPRPSRTKRQDIYRIEEFRELDQHSSTLPRSLLYKSYSDFVSYLVAPARSDLERVRVIFHWLTSLDLRILIDSIHASSSFELPDHGSPLDDLLKIHYRLGNYAQLLAKVCRTAGLNCVVVSGITKSSVSVGSIDPVMTAGQWNAVLIEGEWFLMDAFWASVCLVQQVSRRWCLLDTTISEEKSAAPASKIVHAINDFYFLPNAAELVKTHLPDDPVWQLLNNPISLEEFETSVYVRERFFEMGLEMMNPALWKGRLLASRGEVMIGFILPAEHASNCDFRHLLYKSSYSDKDVQRDDRKSRKYSEVPLERYVLYEKQVQCASYQTRLPVIGQYRLDIYGMIKPCHDAFDLICSYVIDCYDVESFMSSDMNDSEVEPLPDCPDIGWGPGQELAQVELLASTHNSAVLDSDNGCYEISFKSTDENVTNAQTFLTALVHNVVNQWQLSRHVIVRQEEGYVIVNVRLPQAGEYALKLYVAVNGVTECWSKSTAEQPCVSQPRNICNYLLRALSKECVNGRPYPPLRNGQIGKTAVADQFRVHPVISGSSIIKARAGTNLRIDFTAEVSNTEILCQVTSNGKDDKQLSERVERIDDMTLSINLPPNLAHECTLNIYTRKKGKTEVHLVHSYLVQCSVPKNAENKLNNVNGKCGPKCSETPVVCLTTTQSEIVIELPSNTNQVVGELWRTDAIPHLDSATQYSEVVKRCDDHDDISFTISLHEIGNYELDLFVVKDGGGLQRLEVYDIMKEERRESVVQDGSTLQAELSEEELRKIEEEKERDKRLKIYRENLAAALNSGDFDRIRQAIMRLEENGASEEELDNARLAFNFIRLSTDLTQAMVRRHLSDLQRVIDEIERHRLGDRLVVQLAMAERIAEKLKRIERLRHAILTLDQQTIAEIKSYVSPPDAVHRVMAATFMLLGDIEKSVKDWRAVQLLIGRTGRRSLKRRVLDFHVADLTLGTLLKVKAIIGHYQMNEIRDTSAGAATFYVWSLSMIEEAELRYLQAGEDLSAFPTSSKLPKSSYKMI